MSGSKKVFTTLGSSNHVPEEREAFDYAWYVWEKGFTGDPVIKWFN